MGAAGGGGASAIFLPFTGQHPKCPLGSETLIPYFFCLRLRVGSSNLDYLLCPFQGRSLADARLFVGCSFKESSQVSPRSRCALRSLLSRTLQTILRA